MLRPGLVVDVPGDKSVSHRAVLFAAMAQGTTRVVGLLDAEDVGRTVQAVRQLGADARWLGEVLHVTGRPWQAAGSVDCGNSGTTARLLLGALAPRAGATLVGDASLSRRPMRRVLGPLGAMGADIEGSSTLPLTVRARPLRGIEAVAEVASAQVKSAVLLAGLAAEGPTVWTEPVPTRDHTERMLVGMGADLRRTPTPAGARIELRPGGLVSCGELSVPGDISSAAFWLVAAVIHPDVSLTVRGVGVNPTRAGVLDVLRRMGAELVVAPRGGVEPVADVTIRAAGLRGVHIGGAEIPNLIDELPVLAVAAAFAEGDTVVTDAAELRVKESDRVAAVVAGLRAIGVDADARPDGFVVRGQGPGAALRGGDVRTEGDHRIAMAFSIAGLRAPVRVDELASTRTSYPGFAATLAYARG